MVLNIDKHLFCRLAIKKAGLTLTALKLKKTF